MHIVRLHPPLPLLKINTARSMLPPCSIHPLLPPSIVNVASSCPPMFVSDFSTCFRDDRLCPFPSSFPHSGMSQLMLSRGRGTSRGTRDIGRTGQGHNRRHHLAVIFICHLPTPSLRMGHGSAACVTHESLLFWGFQTIFKSEECPALLLTHSHTP